MSLLDDMTAPTSTHNKAEAVDIYSGVDFNPASLPESDTRSSAAYRLRCDRGPTIYVAMYKKADGEPRFNARLVSDGANEMPTVNDTTMSRIYLDREANEVITGLAAHLNLTANRAHPDELVDLSSEQFGSVVSLIKDAPWPKRAVNWIRDLPPDTLHQ